MKARQRKAGKERASWHQSTNLWPKLPVYRNMATPVIGVWEILGTDYAAPGLLPHHRDLSSGEQLGPVQVLGLV